MMNDQAAGLRRIFNATLPKVAAIVPCSAVTTSWLAGRVSERMSLHSGRRLLVLDEWTCFGGVGDCLGIRSRCDLLQAIDGRVVKTDCVAEDREGLIHVRVGALANTLGEDRIRTRRGLHMLRELCAESDECVLVPSLDTEIHGFSPLLRSAVDILLVLDNDSKSVTLAWSVLRGLKEVSKGMIFWVCQIGSRTEVSRKNIEEFCRLAYMELGIALEVIVSIDQLFDRPDSEQSVVGQSFMERLEWVCFHSRCGVEDWKPKVSKPLLV